MLRVYAAAHGLTSTHHAVVEIGAEEIVLRVDSRWVRFTRDKMESSHGVLIPFAIGVDGRVKMGDAAEEMDMAAEEVARKMLAEPDGR
jgi:hypothetical protein